MTGVSTCSPIYLIIVSPEVQHFSYKALELHNTITRTSRKEEEKMIFASLFSTFSFCCSQEKEEEEEEEEEETYAARQTDRQKAGPIFLSLP